MVLAGGAGTAGTASAVPELRRSCCPRAPEAAESPDGEESVAEDGESPEDDERCVSWLASAMADLEPVTVGQYLGDSDLSRRQVKFLSDENFQRLQEIRAERDPDGLFVGYLAGPDGATNRNHWE